MRIEGIQGVGALRHLPVVARLRGVSAPDSVAHADQSRNRMIAAVNGTPNATAVAPTRRLTLEERELLEKVRSTAAGVVTRQARPEHALASASAGRPDAPAADPPSLPIRPAEPPSPESRSAARGNFGREVSHAYARAGSELHPGRHFDIVV